MTWCAFDYLDLRPPVVWHERTHLSWFTLCLLGCFCVKSLSYSIYFKHASRPLHDSRFEGNFSHTVHASPPLCICRKKVCYQGDGKALSIVLPHGIINRLGRFIKLSLIINLLFNLFLENTLVVTSHRGEEVIAWSQVSLLEDFISVCRKGKNKVLSTSVTALEV